MMNEGKIIPFCGVNKVSGHIWLLHNMKLDGLCRLPAIRTVELVRLQQAGCVGRVGETMNAHQMLMYSLVENDQFKD